MTGRVASAEAEIHAPRSKVSAGTDFDEIRKTRLVRAWKPTGSPGAE